MVKIIDILLVDIIGKRNISNNQYFNYMIQSIMLLSLTANEIAFISVFLFLFLLAAGVVIGNRKRTYKVLNQHANRLNQLECEEHIHMEVNTVVQENRIIDKVNTKVYFRCPTCGKEWYKELKDLNPAERTAFFKFNHKQKNNEVTQV